MTKGTYLKSHDVIVEKLPGAPWYLLRDVPKAYAGKLEDGQKVEFVGRTVYGTPFATSIQPYPLILTVKEVAALLHIHVNTARRWSDQGIIESYRTTSRGYRRFRREDVINYIESMREQ